MNAYITFMNELLYFLGTGGSLQTSSGPSVDCSSLGHYFMRDYKMVIILILFFLFLKNIYLIALGVSCVIDKILPWHVGS